MMKKNLIIIVIFSVISCKTSKNYIVSDEKYDVVKALIEKFSKKKKYSIYHKTTYARKVHFENNDYHNWSVYINFDQFSYNYNAEAWPNKINFRDYLTSEDLQYIKSQINKQTRSKKWIRNRLPPDIKLSRNKEDKGFVLSEPVFSKDHTMAMMLRLQGGGTDIVVCRKKEGVWHFFGVIPIMMS